MFERGTLKVLAMLMLVYGLLYLPARIWPGHADSPVGLLFAVPFISVYAFHSLGIPGLLQHDGACGWGWCAPTPFGWAFLAVFWIGLAWLVARACVTAVPGTLIRRTRFGRAWRRSPTWRPCA